jgi:glutamine amidotransferase
MITVIDYRMGNSGSIMNMLFRLGVEARLSSDPEEIARSEKLILPGVGAFDDGMRNLSELGIAPVLRQAVERNRPLLAICLGMQLLTNCSEEGCLPGLGLIPGRVIRFRFDDVTRKIPHMAWNTIGVCRPTYIFENAEPEARFYFVHSYHLDCDREEDVLARTEYGITFTSAVGRGAVVGVQFHPEKSLRWGLRVFKNFIEHA